MWYLLVAAGAGYFAQRWQNAHKERLLLSLKCQDEKASPPSSAPATPKSSSFSLLETNNPEATQNANTSSNGFFDKEDTSIDCKAPFSCYVSKSAEDHLSHQQVNTIDAPHFNLSHPQVLKPNKRSACEAFLVHVPNTVKPSEGSRKDEIAAIRVPNFDFSLSKQNTQDQYISTPRPTSESTPSPGFTNIQGDAKDQVIYTSKSHLDSVDIDDKEEQLQGDSSSPSSCCSSSSTVLNSPVGRKPIQQKDGAFQFRGKEERLESNNCGQLNTLQKHVGGSSCPSFLHSSALKGSGQGGAPSVSAYDYAQENHSGFLQRTSSWGSEELLATSIHVPYVFKGGKQRSLSRTENLSNDFICDDKVEPAMIQKQSTLSKSGNTIFAKKVSSLESTSCSVAAENAREAESESLVSFGLAMAVCFMVSSSKKEMENMGKVLKETEDLVSDMRKELEERRAPPCVTSLTLADNECIEELLTVKSKDAATQAGKADMHTDSLCQVGFSDDESIRSVVTEEHAQSGLHISDLESGHENKPHFVETNVESYLDKQNEECDSEDEKDSSTPEETGEDDYVLSLLELERKLWRVFQERQEEKILGLEEALERALSELQEKEEELQWWKNRAAWLMERPVGTTSGALPVVKPWVERVEEGLNRTDASSFSIKTCSNLSEKIGNGFPACNTNTLEFSAAGETNFLDLEEECIEIVGSVDGLKNRAGHQNRMVRAGSDCSISSSEDSFLSSDVRTFTYPGYMGSMEPC